MFLCAPTHQFPVRTSARLRCVLLARDERFVFPNGLYKRVASRWRSCVTHVPTATLNHNLTPPFAEP